MLTQAELRERLLNAKQELLLSIDFARELLASDQQRLEEHLAKYGDLRMRDSNGMPLSKELPLPSEQHLPTINSLLRSIHVINQICGIENKRPRKYEVDYEY